MNLLIEILVYLKYSLTLIFLYATTYIASLRKALEIVLNKLLKFILDLLYISLKLTKVLLNRIKIGRVGRQVEQHHSRIIAELLDPFRMMNRGIIYN